MHTQRERERGSGKHTERKANGKKIHKKRKRKIRREIGRENDGKRER